MRQNRRSRKDVRRPLLAWYDAHRRELPWRASADPYCIWVSEIMLQQTRVETVLPYYHRWIGSYPDLETLAAADLHDVLRHWEGLGYYARARNLHGAARVVRETLNGAIPSAYDALRALPGVGDYTAGAIASIAYGQRVPAVDGNVRRVLSRLFDMPAPNAAAVREWAAGLVDPARPGDFNQALMDLGSSVCTPRDPACVRCPLEPVCAARAHDTIALRPGKRVKKTLPHESVHTLLLLRDNCVLLEQRPAQGLLAGMWQFPATGKPPRNARMIGEVTHTFSHKRITYIVHHVTRPRRSRQHQRWVDRAELHTYPLPSAQRKIEKLIPAE